METTTSGGPVFNIPGQLEVRGHAGDVALPAARARTLLALLLIRANRVVSVDEIIDRMWDHRPATTRVQVLTVVSSLRRAPGDTAVSPDRRLLITNSPGYLLRVEDDQLDAARFESLLARVDRDRLTGEAAITVLQAALALWRGPALADVPAPFATVAARPAGRVAVVRGRTRDPV